MDISYIFYNIVELVTFKTKRISQTIIFISLYVFPKISACIIYFCKLGISFVFSLVVVYFYYTVGLIRCFT